MLAKEHLECVLSQSVVKVCMWVCVNITSPVLDPTSYITWGSVFLSPGDSQSVLALQYKGIVIFKKRLLSLGAVLCEPVCGTAQLEYVCVIESVCMLAVALSQYIFMHRSVTGKWLLGIAEHWSPARLKKMGTVIVLQ